MFQDVSEIANQAERIQVEMEQTPEEKRVRIRLESYDAKLGWYSSGCLVLPLNQLPLLEQAVLDMRAAERNSRSETATIIPFPGLTDK